MHLTPLSINHRLYFMAENIECVSRTDGEAEDMEGARS